ncbi:MAG TPA: hypothetical protein VJ965_11175 [Anaerolineales bacterium]|nr:hypothetical protein [Anaerolineales bacterium]
MSQKDRLRVMVIAGDPGGASALVPVIRELKASQNFSVHVFAYYKAVNVFRQREVEFSALSNELTDEMITAKIVQGRPDLLLTGTSVNPYFLELQFIFNARNCGIPSLAILDFWSNYAQRFSLKGMDQKYLPDKIAVMDQLAVTEMVEAGFPADRLVITGQPAFDRLIEMRQNLTPAERMAFRENLGVGEEDFLVMYISQPFMELFGSDESNPDYPGFTQQTIFAELLHVLESIAENAGFSITLAILPHLREIIPWWEEVESSKIELLNLPFEEFEKQALATDLVTGMTSTRLVEASLLGRDTLSIQIGGRDIPFDMQRLGITEMVFQQDTLEAFLTDALVDKKNFPTPSSVKLDGQAAFKAARLVKEMLGIEVLAMKENEC